jgi:hypothetical protein
MLLLAPFRSYLVDLVVRSGAFAALMGDSYVSGISALVDCAYGELFIDRADPISSK